MSDTAVMSSAIPAAMPAAMPPAFDAPQNGDASSAASTQSVTASFVKHAKLISGLTLISRLLGMVREAVSAHYFGAGLVSVAFTFAFSVPNLFRKLFGEGALSAAFIPVYCHAMKEESEGQTTAGHRTTQSAADFAAASVNLLCLALLVVTLLGEAALWASIKFAGPMRPERLLTLKFTAIMLPYVLLICGTAFLSSILQVHRRFAAPAAAPIILNVCHIVVIILGGALLGIRHVSDPRRVEQLQTTLAYWLCGFVLIAGVLQVISLLPALRAVGFKFRWVSRFWTPPIKRMLRLSAPVALGAGVLQLSVLMDKGISLMLSQGVDQHFHAITHFQFLGHWIRFPMEDGAPTRLGWAQFLYQFPLGVFAIALATAIFPGLSSDALDKDRQRFRSVLRLGIEAALFEGFAASAGLIIVRFQAAQLLFQHGNTTHHDAMLTAKSVLFYSGAIWAFGLLQIINRAYYALHDTRTPLVMATVNILLNLAVELPLVWLPWLGESGMAIGTAVSFAVQALWMLYLLDRRIGGLELKRLAAPVLKMLFATGCMIAACWAIQRTPIFPRNDSRSAWAIQLLLLMTTGGVVYLGLCTALGVSVMEHLVPKRLAGIRRRLIPSSD